MTAEPRDVEEIRADIARQRHREVLARLAAADRENAELRGEVERLRAMPVWNGQWVQESIADRWKAERDEARALIARQLGDCIGCSPETGPEETCPHDGRTYTEWVEIASMVIGRQHANDAERDDLRAQLAAAQAQLAEARAWLALVRRWESCGESTGIASNRCMLPPGHVGAHDCQLVPGSVAYFAALSAAPQPEPCEHPATFDGALRCPTCMQAIRAKSPDIDAVMRSIEEYRNAPSGTASVPRKPEPPATKPTGRSD